MAFNNFPYTNFQDLNLGWILGKLGVVERLATDSAASVAQYDARITANTNAIEQLGVDLESISDVARVFVNSSLEAYYRGEHITGSELLSEFQSHGTLPFVEYNNEVYMLDSVSNAGDMRFSMGHTVDAFNELVIRHIMIPAQSYNAAYSITNVSAGSGSSGNVFAVKITPNTGTGEGYICDHTYAEIYSQMQNGKIPILLVSQGSNPTFYEICGAGRTGTKRTVSGQTVQEIEFVDPHWMTGNNNDVGVWTIDANNNIGHIASLKQLATLDNIIQFVNDGVTTNALLKTAQTLSAAEKTQVKQNIGISDSGGSYSPYVIPVTMSGGAYSTTATGYDVFDHILDCRINFNGLYYYPIGSGLSGAFGHAYFACNDPHTSGKYDVDIFDVELNGNNACTVTKYEKDINLNPETEKIIISASASSIPPIEPNKFYLFSGETSALNITLATPANSNIANEYHFMFTSGATATTLTIPSSVKQPDGFTVESNHVYEVSILENCMTAQGWAVTA